MARGGRAAVERLVSPPATREICMAQTGVEAGVEDVQHAVQVDDGRGETGFAVATAVRQCTVAVEGLERPRTSGPPGMAELLARDVLVEDVGILVARAHRRDAQTAPTDDVAV